LARVIQQEIKKPLADQLLFGGLVTGGHVVVDVVDGAPTFAVTPAKPAAKAKADDGEEPEAVEGETGDDAGAADDAKTPEPVR
ncbi:MAG: hypothetical protein SFV21_14350, partial [Rhodospirillaceae bacterium]|nr:hypothetical protein [Rhodospirillaceae bacterium]